MTLSAGEISTPKLAQMCHEESEQYRRHRSSDRGHCYELFRRAIVDCDERAWDFIYGQYQRLVIKWVRGPDGCVDDRVNGTWVRFWKAIDPATFPRKFAGTGKIIRFLQACARSECIDEHRREEKQELLADLEDVTEANNMTANPAIDKVVQDELFAYIEEQLRDDQERLVIHLSFRVGLAPRLIAREYPEIFDSIAEIRRIKERVVLRLSTDLRLRDWWNPPTRLGKSE